MATITNTFTSTGTWICPPGVSSVQVQAFGGGGAGGRQQNSTGSCGGGGGGEFAQENAVAVTPGTSYTVTVGAGGVSAASPTNGGDSQFTGNSLTVTAHGGQTPANNVATAGAAGTGSTNATHFNGGAGAAGATGGGGGGSSAGTAAIGNAGSSHTGGAAPVGGAAGGGGATTANTQGTAASSPGGAGGGGYRTTSGTIAGGAGGGGQVALTFNDPFIQGNTFAGGSTGIGSQAVAFLSNVTAGDLIVVVASWSLGSGDTDMTLTDTQGNTYSSPMKWYITNLTPNFGTRIFYAIAATTGPCTITATLSPFNAAFTRILIHEYVGYSAFDVGDGINYAGTTATKTITTTVASDLIVAFCTDNTGVNSYSAPLAVRLTASGESSGDNTGTTNTAGVQTITCNTGSGPGGMYVASFKPTSGGPATVSGAVTMAGTAGMTVSGAVTELATVALAGSASMTVASSVTELAGTTLSGSASLTVSATVKEVATVSMSASASLTASATVAGGNAAVLSATAGLTAAGQRTAIAGVSMTGSATLLVGGTLRQFATVSMSATASLACAANTSVSGTVQLIATTGMVVVATTSIPSATPAYGMISVSRVYNVDLAISKVSDVELQLASVNSVSLEVKS